MESAVLPSSIFSPEGTMLMMYTVFAEKAKTETRCTKIAMCTAVVIDGGMTDEEMGRNNHRNTFQDSFG